MTRNCATAERRWRVSKKFAAIRNEINKKINTITAPRVDSTFFERLIHRPLLSVRATLWTSTTAMSEATGKKILGTFKLNRLSAATLTDHSRRMTTIMPSNTNTDHGSTAPCASAVKTTAARKTTLMVLLRWSFATSPRVVFIWLVRLTRSHRTIWFQTSARRS